MPLTNTDNNMNKENSINKQVVDKTSLKKKKSKKVQVVLDDLYDKGDQSMEYVHHRMTMFDRIYERQQQEARDKKEKITVRILTPTQKPKKASNLNEETQENKTDQCLGETFLTVDAISGLTTPLEIAENHFGKAFVRGLVVAKVDDQLFDVFRPLETDCKLEFFRFDSHEGRHVFQHSSAHVLGQCMERLFGGKLTIGPALEDCYYYDVDMGDRKICQQDYDSIEALGQKIVDEKQPFKRIVMTKEEALEMFKFNKFKKTIVEEKIDDGALCTAYRCGPLIDLCRGPHIPSTELIKAFRVLKHSACYWKGDASNPQLQRIYGLSFPDKKLMKQRLKEIELAKQRDHRIIGRDQKLFFFSNLSPGSAFWQPHGSRIYNKLMDFMKLEYRKRGYDEVMSPNIYNMNLWEISGHAAKYKDDMFLLDVEKQNFAMKPMNCPGHCLMYKQALRSYRELPLRYADFGVLHRNELTGALSGLTRVRRFQQDDAHIFCTIDQIFDEINGCLDFMKHVYGIFGFEFSLVLSTRDPKNFIGTVEVWDQAERALSDCLDKFCGGSSQWKLCEGDGAFYGPKIDVMLHDALGRSIQCATIQLDFNLPSKERFNLEYQSPEGPKHPVIVHRAILGSLERFIGILTEHCGGKQPFQMSPRQVIVVPISDKFMDYAQSVKQRLQDAGYYTECDESDNHVKKKIREAQLAQFNFILVVGEKELESNTVNIRTRDNKVHGTKSVEELIEQFKQLELDFK